MVAKSYDHNITNIASQSNPKTALNAEKNINTKRKIYIPKEKTSHNWWAKRKALSWISF